MHVLQVVAALASPAQVPCDCPRHHSWQGRGGGQSTCYCCFAQTEHAEQTDLQEMTLGRQQQTAARQGRQLFGAAASLAAAVLTEPCAEARALPVLCCAVLQMPFDLFNYLLRQRIIFLAGYVNDKVGWGWDME